jgi:hypothetical protein
MIAMGSVSDSVVTGHGARHSLLSFSSPGVASGRMGLASPPLLLLCGPFHHKHDAAFRAGVPDEARGYPGMEFHHFGFNHLHTLVVGDAHAAIAVLDEVGVACILQAHRRQLFAAIGGPIYALPPR